MDLKVGEYPQVGDVVSGRKIDQTRRAATALAAAVAFAGALSIFATPAHADNSLCPTRSICLFENSHYSGGRYIFDYKNLNLSGVRYDNGDRVDNTSSSVINNTDQVAQLADRYYVPCQGAQLNVQPHTEYSDFSTTPASYPLGVKSVNDLFGCLVTFSS